MSTNNRLAKEWREIRKHTTQQRELEEEAAITLFPKDEKNLHLWTGLIVGPPDSPFHNYRFQLRLSVPTTYPLAPPTVTFVTPVCHPNVHAKTGEICLDILKEAWSPVWGLETTLRAIRNLLASGDASSPLNCDCGNLIRAGDIRGYWALAQWACEEFAERVVVDQPASASSGSYSSSSSSSSLSLSSSISASVESR